MTLSSGFRYPLFLFGARSNRSGCYYFLCNKAIYSTTIWCMLGASTEWWIHARNQPCSSLSRLSFAGWFYLSYVSFANHYSRRRWVRNCKPFMHQVILNYRGRLSEGKRVLRIIKSKLQGVGSIDYNRIFLKGGILYIMYSFMKVVTVFPTSSNLS